MQAANWEKIERILDDKSVGHACAFCGKPIAMGDDKRWGLAVRQLSGKTSVVWCHSGCFIASLTSTVRRVYEKGGPSAPTIDGGS
jgi:hypothetical protein